MRETLKKRKRGKRGTKRHNKAGVINRITRTRQFLDYRIGSDLTPSILQPYAATRLSRSYRRHKTKHNYGNDIGTFYYNLIVFKNVLLVPSRNPDAMVSIKERLLNSIPQGAALGRFLDRPYIIHNIRRLREQLSGDFVYPVRGTSEHTQLLGLVEDIKGIIKVPLHQRARVPPVMERQTRARESPTSVYDLV